jgi:hypothetical protein
MFSLLAHDLPLFGTGADGPAGLRCFAWSLTWRRLFGVHRSHRHKHDRRVRRERAPPDGAADA